MGHRKFSDIAGEISPERRARIDAIKEEARADQADGDHQKRCSPPCGNGRD